MRASVGFHVNYGEGTQTVKQDPQSLEPPPSESLRGLVMAHAGLKRLADKNQLTRILASFLSAVFQVGALVGL